MYLICSNTSDRGLPPFSHIRNFFLGTLAFILLVTFNCFLSSSLSCLILPHVSRISKIHLFSATSWANCGWHRILHSLLCFCLHKWFSKVFLTHSTVEHYVVPAPSQSSTLSSILSTGAKHTEKLKPLCWEAGLWESGTCHSEDILMQRVELTFIYFFKKTNQHTMC